VTQHITTEKKIEITPMGMYLTLALPIGGMKVEEFYGRSQNTLNIIKSFYHGERNEILKMGYQSSAKCHSTY